ncbi:uncharacterized protein LOC128093266 [Culex pipiens pallens]|uniref:uncharacterized protein LOC128093266 n=1 Tax=Culex pipiens pallens TaxID=42434 RepID=UPI0022AA275F|nr:uncharacterized protein LOC128093266 [Culex pipiens pallens]
MIFTNDVTNFDTDISTLTLTTCKTQKHRERKLFYDTRKKLYGINSWPPASIPCHEMAIRIRLNKRRSNQLLLPARVRRRADEKKPAATERKSAQKLLAGTFLPPSAALLAGEANTKPDKKGTNAAATGNVAAAGKKAPTVAFAKIGCYCHRQGQEHCGRHQEASPAEDRFQKGSRRWR